MQRGSEPWLEEAEKDKHTGNAIPRAYLTRLNQKNQFQILHSRGQVITPDEEESESKLEDTWIGFIGDNTTDTKPSLITLGKKPNTIKLFTEKSMKLAKWQQLLRDTPSETGCFSESNEVHTDVPILLPLPWAWAATLANNPQWSIQDTTRFIMLATYSWNRESDRETIGKVMKFVLGATTARTATAKKSNPKVLLPFKTTILDQGAAAFVSEHTECNWTNLEEKPRRAAAPRSTNTEKQSPTAGARKPPNKRATPGTKRPPSDPQRGTHKATKAAKTATTSTPRKQEKEHQAEEDEESTSPHEDTDMPPTDEADDDSSQPSRATPQQQETTTSIITPELINSLRGSPENMTAVINAILDKERQEAQQKNMMQASLAAVNNVALAAIKAAQANGAGTTGKGKWNTAKQARFAGYCGRKPDDAHMPTFWKRMIQAASDDKETIIQELLNDLGDKHDEFRSWLAPPHFLDDIKKLVLRPIRTEKGFFRGLSPLAFADRDQAEIHQSNEQRKLHANYAIQLNGSEAERLEAKAPPMPQTSEKLQLYIKRWKLFLLETFGNKCELVREANKGWRILQKNLPRIMSTSDFMRRRGNSIGWELSLATDEFFKQIVTMTDYDMAAEDTDSELPKAHCDLSWNEILTIHGPPAGDLPLRLRPHQQGDGYNNHNGGSPGHNNNQHNNKGHHHNGYSNNTTNTNHTNNTHRQTEQQNRKRMTTKGTWPAPFKALLGSYHPAERKKFSLRGVLKEANQNRDWLQEQLAITPDTCCSTIMFGQCPETCTLNHTVTIDTTKALNVANKLKNAVSAVERQRNISNSNNTST